MRDLHAAFVDTGAWATLRYGRDQHHARARSILVRLRDDGLGFVTTEWLLAEAVTLPKARGGIDQVLALGDAGWTGSIARASPR